MENIINLKAFREDTAKYLDQIEKGKTFVVFKRSKPAFTISPVKEADWVTIADFSKMKGGGVPIEKLITALKKK